jgi:hypothetical protein
LAIPYSYELGGQLSNFRGRDRELCFNYSCCQHSIVAFYYQTKESCEDDGGKYEEGESTCFFKNIEDNFDINEKSTNNIDVTISKIGYNFHMCDFQAPGLLIDDKLIVSKVEENGCEVQIKLIDNNTVSISANTQCQFYCGAGMSLDTEQAVRVNKPL